MSKITQKSPAGQIVKQIVREVSLVDRAANGESEMIEIKDDSAFEPVEGYLPSKELVKELVGCGLVSAAQLYHADTDEQVDSDEPEQIQKNLNAAAFALVEASVEFEKALAEVLPEVEQTELEKAGVPKATQRPQVLKFLKGVVDSMKDLLKKAGFATDDDVEGASIVESTAPDKKTKMTKGEGTPMTEEELKAIGEVVAVAVTKAMEAAKPQEPQAPAEDPKIAALEKSIASLTEAINAETGASTIQKQAAQVSEQGSKIDQLMGTVSELTTQLTQLRKARIEGLSLTPEAETPKSFVDTLSDDQIMYLAQKRALGGHNPLGMAADEFSQRVGLTGSGQ